LDPHLQPPRRSLRAVEWLNFFLADVQTGLGPFLAAYLTANGWNPARVGYMLTFGGLTTVALQTPAGAVIDAAHRKRALLAVALAVLVTGALLLTRRPAPLTVYLAQFLIGGSAAFLGPTLAAITMGIVGSHAFDRQFGRNQSFNSAGNVVAALLIGWVSFRFGFRIVFGLAALMAVPALTSLLAIDGDSIDYARSRAAGHDGEGRRQSLSVLLRDRVLLFFLAAVFLFHLANAAMLPELGEMLARHNLRASGPFMSACIVVTQAVIALGAAGVGRLASLKGRRPLLLLGFGDC
jgi:MFS family permease